jgi:SAM-dependent methyltransferase
MAGYAFDNAWHQARERLSKLETCLDPATIRRMSALGVAEGWNCLDVGAGGGSITAWLCEQVGPTGRVVATDVDTRFLDALSSANLEVLRHDVTEDELPANTFDLVHTRWVLMHLPARQRALERLVSTIKPGGWLLVEEADTFPVSALEPGAYGQIWSAFMRAIAPHGTHGDWARELPSILPTSGLSDVGVDADFQIFMGASPLAEFWRLTWEQLRSGIVQSGAQEAQIDETLRSLSDPTQHFIGPATFAVWGRRN